MRAMGPVVVVTDANTIFRTPDVEETSLDEGSTELAAILAIGDCVGAAGWWEEERGEGSVFHAFGIAWVEPDHVFPLAGKLTEVSDDTLTVDLSQGAFNRKIVNWWHFKESTALTERLPPANWCPAAPIFPAWSSSMFFAGSRKAIWIWASCRWKIPLRAP